MKNLIIQHWNGPLPLWAQKCKQSVADYAEQIGAEYQLLSGYPFIAPPDKFEVKPWTVIQKIYMIDSVYDKYENVLMLDMDMMAITRFPVDNIFNYEGIGRLHLKSMSGLNNSRSRLWPKLYKEGAPAFFGNCVKLTKEERVTLRSVCDKEEIINASNDGLPPNDESIMHYLMHRSNVLKNKKVLELPHSKFCDLVEEAHPEATLIHFCGPRKNSIK